MATRKKRPRRPADTYEHLCFHIESSTRSYHFGINRANRKLFPEHFSEFDYVEIFGSIREKIDRPIQHVRLHISPAEVPRDQLNPEAQAIGSVETRKRPSAGCRAGDGAVATGGDIARSTKGSAVAPELHPLPGAA